MTKSVYIGVCTFRRRSLFQTLDSLQRLARPPETDLTVVVSDNDETPALADEVAAYAERSGLAITYVHAPARNISIARNACLTAAEGSLLACLDDDEVADPNWIVRLLETAEHTGAGVVLGPAVARYPDTAPHWMRENDFHSNRPSPRGDVVETGFSSNVLLDLRDPRIAEARFDPAFGRTGGEDVDFFFRLHRKGVLMVIDNEAIVHEPVAPSRMSFQWLLRRKRMTGAIYSHCAVNGDAWSRVKLLCGSVAKIGYCGLRALVAFADRTRCTFWLMRGSFHTGVFLGCLSPPRREVYGAG